MRVRIEQECGQAGPSAFLPFTHDVLCFNGSYLKIYVFSEDVREARF